MDKKKALKGFIAFLGLFIFSLSVYAQNPDRLQFCDREYAYGPGNDSIKLYFNVFGANGKTIPDISQEDFSQFFNISENGRQIENFTVKRLNTGIRIPKEFTFSILLDQSIPTDGKERILDAVKNFINLAPDSCIYISFYGDEVSNTVRATKENIGLIEQTFLTDTEGKAFYSGVYSKLAEFIKESPDMSEVKSDLYEQNKEVAKRAELNPEKNILMIFSEGSRRPDDELLDIISVEDLQGMFSKELPKVYGFYYTAEGENAKIEDTLNILANPKDSIGNLIINLRGNVKSSSSMAEVLSSFQETIEESAYGYELLYQVPEDMLYSGNIEYVAKWGSKIIGTGLVTIGSAERPWPERPQSTVNAFVELIVAILITIATLCFFLLVVKIFVPFVRSLMFRSKYYKKYEPQENVTRRICHYCKQELRPGQVIVAKCDHWMHKHCWEENGYKCAEYGQNCKTGIQEHIDWKEVFSLSTLKDSSQTIAGVLAGLISWIIYEIAGREGWGGFSKFIVSIVFSNPDDIQASLFNDCVVRTSSFLMIGLLLGFFISVIFRYKDDIRNKSWKVWLKIFLLSLFSGFIGMLSFAIGADIFCLILEASHKTYIPWYCSLPAYVLFSICVSLTLSIKSTIPVKSALLGGLISAIIGFIVLYFTHFTSARYQWVNLLLDFIIYGGGLGISLVTVRMLSERYFLVIQNGVKAGQRIPIHKWMNATGGGNKVSIGMTGECEIQMNWEKSNKVAKEHAQLFIDHDKNLPVIKPMAPGVIYNSRADLPVSKTAVLCNGDTFKIGDTIFKYEEA